jgi:hypothetical protein
MSSYIATDTGVAKMKFRLSYIGSDESNQIGLAFKPNPDDVFITTFPKCGTTWVSFILHSLRSRGNMEFCEITEVVPWTAMAALCCQTLTDPQKYNPRLFKSHEDWTTVPKGGKYVYVVRNPPEVIVSYYEFLQNVAKVCSIVYLFRAKSGSVGLLCIVFMGVLHVLFLCHSLALSCCWYYFAV